MKKIQLTFLFISICILSLAQTEKGSKLLGASIGAINIGGGNTETSYTNSSVLYNTDANSFSISVNPTIMWFIQNNLAVGANVAVGFSSSKNRYYNSASSVTSESTYSSPSFYIGPTARYYFGGSAKGMPFVQAAISLSFYPSNSKSTSSAGSSATYDTKSSSAYTAGAAVGYEHFINKSFGIIAKVGFDYNHNSYTTDYKPSTGIGYSYSGKTNSWAVPISLGVQVHLAAKSSK